MTELLFPSGQLVRIDESAVWRALSDWLGAAEGRDVQMRRNSITGSFCCRLNDDGAEHVGRSQLGTADALAQALQIAACSEVA